MYIRIKKGVIREPLWFTPLSEDVKITILNYNEVVSSDDIKESKTLYVDLHIMPFNSNGRRGNSPDLPTSVNIPVELSDSIVSEIHAYKVLIDYLLELLNKERTEKLVKGTDVSIEIAEEWKETFGANLVVPRNVRVTIPKDLLLTTYEPVMYKVKQGWREDGVVDADFPFVMTDKAVTAYFNNMETLNVEELAYISADPNVLIEVRNVV